MANSWNAAVVYRNLAQAGTVTASSQVLDARAGEVLTEQPSEKWHSTSTPAWIINDLGTSVSVDTFAAVGLNATTVRLRISNSDPTAASALLHDSGVVAVDQNYLQAVFALSSPVTGRYVRFDFTNGGDDHVEVGCLVAGLRSTYATNYDYGASITTPDLSRRRRLPAGATQIDVETIYRAFTANFGWISDEDRWGFVEDMERYARLSRNVLFLMDPSAANLARATIFGLIAEATPIVVASHELHAKSYTIEERL